ncbi:MAG: imidazolonepropionase [Deltaproteobacteria bacterium]|nr:MAG: imidazolonepropionase [Deltaproteobacteria bacterium]
MIERAEVVRRGAAVRVYRAGGDARLVRLCDLAPHLGEPVGRPRRVRDARARGGALELAFDDGAVERVAAADLWPPAGRVDLVVDRAGLVMTCDGDGTGEAALGCIPDAAVALGGGRVVWVGPAADLPADARGAPRLDAGGRLVTPGLVDPHAHPVFAGDRAGEFALRAAGASYRDIAAAGGGIAATLGPTRAASVDDHVRLTAARMDRALAHGTTTCEAKSGYALTVAGELALLEAIAEVDALHPVDLVPTVLGAHVVPPDRAGDRDAFVAEVADRLVPEVARRGLATSADVYCDDGAFTAAETRRILAAARAAGLAVRAHVGQFADLGGAELLAELGALSADHLEHVSADGIAALAAAGVTAVMLPGACVQLRMAPPPVAALRAAGVALAVGTDLNPGTSFSEALPLQMWLATTHYGMTVDEAWLGVTRAAARALGRHDVGRLAPGTRADLVVWDAASPAEIPYHYGVNLVSRVVKAGRIVRS